MDAQPGFVVVASLTRPRGVKGEICSVALTDDPDRYARLRTVYVNAQPYEVERVWYHKGQPVFKFRGIDSVDGIARLAGQDVSIPLSERAPLAEGEYYFADLIGCRVVDSATGSTAGVVTGWQDVGGPVVLELDGGQVLVPYAKAIVAEIDLAAREIRANLPDGLLELNR